MDNKIRTTLVAAAVSAALTGTAFAATHAPNTDTGLPNFDFNAKAAQKAIKSGKKSLNTAVLRQGKTVNGQAVILRSKTDHFDPQLNVSTFSWASEGQAAVAHNVLNRKAAISESVKHFARTNGGQHGVTARAFNQAELKSTHDLGRGAIISKYQQKVNGLEVFGRQFNVVLNQDMELVATSGYFSKAAESKKPVSEQFKVSATKAISKAFANMGGDSISLSKIADKGQYAHFQAQGSDSYTFTEQPRSKMGYYPVKGELIPAYFIEIIAAKKGSTNVEGYSYIVSAADGELLNRTNLVNHESAFTYNVFADDTAPYRPYDSPFGNELSPHPTGVYTDVLEEVQLDMNHVTVENTGISTNDPWLAMDATTTSGNNVDAYADLTAPDGYNAPTTDDDGNVIPGDVRTQTSSANTFDYQFTQSDPVNTDDNLNAAIVNLFYVNNYLHDLYYDHGFDEASGNAQVDNYGRGGEGDDPLHVEAQDSGGINNANMLTPSDGSSPRMQMFLWVGLNSTMTVSGLETVTHQVSGSFGETENEEMTVEIVRMLDDKDTTTDGCEPAVNAADLAGKFAMVDRGSCAFVDKANHAQQAGAIGIIVANNDADSPNNVINMGGSDDGITIPAIMVSYNSGQEIYNQLDAGDTVTATFSSGAEFRDGTMDNPIIEHEWGHYLSNRLVGGGGGLSNSQGRSMGEGWSDFIALITMVREEDKMLAGNDMWQGIYNDGGYSINNGHTPNAYYFGLRRTPYTTDMNYNALTFKHIEDQVALPTSHPVNGGAFTMAGFYNSEVHAAGEIWAMALWESYSALLNRNAYSFDEAQSRMMDYMVAGMKITPASPTFTEARDAILAAAIAHDVEDYNVMRDGFTKRGMGINAVSPDRNDPGWDNTGQVPGHVGVVEDFVSVRTEVGFEAIMIDNMYNSATGSYCDMDSTLDVGETSSVMIKLKNVGTKALSGLKVKVESTADITFANDGIIEMSDMEMWNDTATGMVEMTLNSGDVDAQIPISVSVISEDPTVMVPKSYEMVIDSNRDFAKDPTRTFEDFGHIGATWSDWTEDKIGIENSGVVSWLNNWRVMTPDEFDIGIGNFMWGPNGVVETDATLTTPMVTVGETGAFSMQFIHYYDFEAGSWDGGVVEISVDGGEWTDVLAAGGQFMGGGYSGVVVDYNQILGNREAFVNELDGEFALKFEGVEFADGALNGKDVQFRFRIGTDAAAGAWGWNIDQVAFDNYTNALFSSVQADDAVCANRAPVVMTTEQSVDEIVDGAQNTVTLGATVIDHDAGDAMSYSWTQTGGSEVTLSDATSATPSFTVPVLGADETFTFDVTVSDGTASSTTAAEVHVANTNVAPVITGGTAVSVKERQSISVSVSGSDIDGDDLTYSWKVNGASSNNHTNTYLYPAPAVTEDMTVTITVTATDGQAMSNTETFTVTVENGDGGGGSMGLWSLLLAPLAFIRRRKVQK